MSSRVPGTPGDGREEKGKGTGRRLFSKMMTALKRAGPSKRQSTQQPVTAAATLPASSPAAAEPWAETTPAPSTSPLQPHQMDATPPQLDDTPPAFDGEKIPRAQIYGERAQYLSERFGLDADYLMDNYRLDGHVLRVHKPLRMRVHRQCHQCGSNLNATGSCEQCSHNFCGQCTRYPPSRNETEKAASRDRKAEILKERSANAMIIPDPSPGPNQMVVVRKPAAQQELVYKKIRQRVRRVCCQCQESGGSEVRFVGGNRNCSKCDHVRCTDCPRDPAKKSKYPYGYPGDEFGTKSIAYFRCHECSLDYPPGVENGTACSNCSHEKCDDCKRLRPQRIEPKPDPGAVKSVQEKMAAMRCA